MTGMAGRDSSRMDSSRTGFVKAVPRAAALAAVLLALGGLSACREHEQGRPLIYHQGEYEGQPDTPLSEEDLRVLQQRALKQAG